MNECTHIEIFKLIQKHKPHFEEKAIEFFKINIEPVYIAYGGKKLNLDYGSNREMWLATKDNFIVKQTSPFLETEYVFNYFNYSRSNASESRLLSRDRIDIVELIPNFIGGGDFYQQAFMYLLSTNLNLFAKYFKVRDLRGWFFHSGVNDFKKKDWIQIASIKELYAFSQQPYKVNMPDLTHYTRPWYEVVKGGGLNRTEMESEGQICDLLKIRTIYEVISDGYLQYQDKIKSVDLGLPKSLNNDMDFVIWKNAISKIKITGSNINEIMYTGDYNARWNYSAKMVEHIWTQYPKVAKRKYFMGT